MPRAKPQPVRRAAPQSDAEEEATETLVARRAGEGALERYAAAATTTERDEDEAIEVSDGSEKNDEDEIDDDEVEEIESSKSKKGKGKQKDDSADLATSNLPPAPKINNFLAQLHAERMARMGGNGSGQSGGSSGPKARAEEPKRARIATMASPSAVEAPRSTQKDSEKKTRAKRGRDDVNYTESIDFEDPEDDDYAIDRDGTMADEDVPKKKPRKSAGKGQTLTGEKPKAAPRKKKPVHEQLDLDTEWTSMPLGAVVKITSKEELQKATELAGDRVVVVLYGVGRGAECRGMLTSRTAVAHKLTINVQPADMESHITALALATATGSASSQPRTLSSSSSAVQPPVFLKINHDTHPQLSHSARVSHFPTVCFWHKKRMVGERVVGWNGGAGGKELEHWISRLGKGV